ncbi:proline-rich protein PRCC [Chanos chanos]|uniref:Proline-rich protein PRCC n=1 Tax=Chanos chanos TaxID=29144 RepID=A0A6J2UKE3_CHACN|nr:proline-rich protein PRCC [Chanos chanos]
MSLVAYGSSDESESEDTPSSVGSEGKQGGLFASLPQPRNALTKNQHDKPSVSHSDQTQTVTHSPFSGVEPPTNPEKMSEADPQLLNVKSSAESLDIKGSPFDLPKPKKRIEPVKITIPAIKAVDSDSDDDEPVRKRGVPQGSGLSSLLPQPKNLVVKESQRALVPLSLSKRPGSNTQAHGSEAASQGLSASSASPSAIKAAAKSAALQLARQMAAEEGSDEELTTDNYFSLEENSQDFSQPSPDPQSSAPTVLLTPSGMENAPLDFCSHIESYAWDSYQRSSYAPLYQTPSTGVLPQPSTQDYYSAEYYQGQDPELLKPDDQGSLFDNEAFRRLQGKQNRGKEEVKFLEIKGDDQLSGSQQWLTKNITKEKEQHKSFSKKKGDQPTGQQRRKHQITYLIHQAKERELELKNTWAENKLTRRQTQAKYGF